MRFSRTPRYRRHLAAGVAILPLLAGVTGVPTTAATAASGPVELLRLVRDGDSAVRAAETPLAVGTTRLRTSTYSMVAATWRGPAPVVSVRTGPDEPWQRLPELADGPSRDTGEARPRLGATELVWTGPATSIDVRVSGRAHGSLDLVLIDPGETAQDRTATPAPPPVAARAGTAAPPPALLSRRDWGADRTWRNGRPRYNDRLRQVHVHHTATGNDYARADVPGILRGMYRYHTQTLGWFDLGYNFLVDRFGRAWVGRSGGVDRLVRGAHTLGFNHTSVGIAMIGNLEGRAPWRPAVRTLVRLAAWKLDAHDRDAMGSVRVASTGSDHYREGRRVRLPVIDGHRDTNQTACPGQRLYDRLPAIRRRAQARIDAR